jgi:hypothetical protein
VFTDIGWVAERFKAAVLKCVADRNPVQSEPRQFAEIRHFFTVGACRFHSAYNQVLPVSVANPVAEPLRRGPGIAYLPALPRRAH